MAHGHLGNWSREHVVLLASAAVLTVAGGVAVIILISRATGPHVSRTATPFPVKQALVGSVSQIKNSSVGTRLDVHLTNDGLKQVPIALGTKLTTLDGHTLLAASIRPGDEVSVAENGDVDDRSQQQSSLSGIVATGLEASSGPMIVQVKGGKDIIVDIASSTQVRSNKNTSLAADLVSTADPVMLSGVLDFRLGEMTQTELMIVTQPVRKPAP
jgi:hypothetical protein